MSLNLYNFHSDSSVLAGVKRKDTVPGVVYQDLRHRYNYGTLARNNLPVLMGLLEKNRDILAKNPATAAEAAIMYSSLLNTSGQRLLPPLYSLDSDVVRSMQADPNSLCRYIMHVVKRAVPDYHNVILRCTPSQLADYINLFTTQLKAQHQRFLDRAFVRVSEEPQQAYELAIISFPHMRVPALEAAIFKYNPDAVTWNYLIDETETRSYPETPDADTDYEYITSGNMREYGEFASPWNLYVSGLGKVADRVAAIETYGFNGDKFRLGYSHELR